MSGKEIARQVLCATRNVRKSKVDRVREANAQSSERKRERREKG